jgi:hypothetical protein
VTFKLIERNENFKKGNIITLSGFCIVGLAALIQNESIQMTCAIIAIGVIIVGEIIVNRTIKGFQVGEIQFATNVITISKENMDVKIPLLQSTKITFLNFGYRDQHAILYMFLGLFKFKTGINKLKIVTDGKKYDFLIVVINETEMKWLKNYLRNSSVKLRILRLFLL